MAWQIDNDIIGGLTDIGSSSSPSVFQKDGTWYLISGEDHGAWFGWKWTCNEWQIDNSIISGLTNVGGQSPSVFQKDGTWYLIAGLELDFFGWRWTGSEWQYDYNITLGLGYVGYFLSPSVFQKDGTWYLIAGNSDGLWCGFHWHESWTIWESDNSIISGLTDVGVNASPSVFQKDGTWYLITGSGSEFFGWRWTGSEWQSNSSITCGLTDVGSSSSPSVFQKDDIRYLISGDRYGGWFGWSQPTTTIPSKRNPRKSA